jgi:phosphate-selective porin OprO/OprP
MFHRQHVVRFAALLLALCATMTQAEEPTWQSGESLSGILAANVFHQAGPEYAPINVPPAPPVDSDVAGVATVTASPVQAGVSPASPRAPPVLPAPVKYPIVDLTGFFQLDSGWVSQDSANPNAILPGPPPAPLGDIPDFTDFRRARLAAKGQVAENFGYYLEMDFAFPGRPSFMDVWVEAQNLEVGNFRVGQFRQPILMDGLTSVRDLTFLERPSMFAFVPFRQTGMMLFGTALEENMTYALSGYRFPADFFGGTAGDNGYGVTTRITGLAFHDDSENLYMHLGGAFSHNHPANHAIRFRSIPEVGTTFGGSGVPVSSPVPFFVDTGPIVGDWFNLYGVEAAFSWGPFLIQSEAMFNQVFQLVGPTSVFFGAYAQASYVLTGEPRPYNKKSAVFGRVTPSHPFGPDGCGAWEIATRLSYIDLNDGLIAGGRMTEFTAGINWYLNKFTKVQLDYLRPWLDNPANGKSNANFVAVRVQLDF